MYKLIAITGFKRSGKDVVSDYISRKYGYNHVKISSKLKSIIKVAFDLTNDDLESCKKDTINKDLDVSPRVLMDFFGTHVFQYELNKVMPNIGRKYWINDLMKKWKNDPIVISDLRFHHEVDEIQKNTCIIMRVNRASVGTDTHLVSEKEISELKVDYELDNNGTLEDLYNQIDVIMKRIDIN